MPENIMQYIIDYAPVVLMLVMMFIDRFGFGNLFSSFRKDITESFNVKELGKEIESLRDEICSVLDENKDLRDQLVEITEALQRVKGTKK